ncbi:cell division protein FtsQ/DivIB, partial [Cellulomonas endophytica]|uniref:cell division protein FtsQ/DivIB n=1 Tax=Cellulomonas endophytica TaxID=2494735 RepID=UPI001F0C7F63
PRRGRPGGVVVVVVLLVAVTAPVPLPVPDLAGRPAVPAPRRATPSAAAPPGTTVAPPARPPSVPVLDADGRPAAPPAVPSSAPASAPSSGPSSAAGPRSRAVGAWGGGAGLARGLPRDVPRGPRRPAVVSTGSAARFAERVRARRTLARRKVAAAAAALVVLGALAWLLLWSPVLALDPGRVTVTGASTVVAVDRVDAVVAARAGTPLPRLDTVALRDDLLEVPGVREVRVMRAWPTGLSVELVARQPVAAVPEPGGGGGFALLDAEGVQVGRADAAPEGLPVVDVPVGAARALAAVLAVLEGLPDTLLAEVSGVAAQTEDTVSLTLRDGVVVEWGSAAQTPLKVAVLDTLRASPTSSGARVVDVSAPTLPITR